MVHTSYLDAKKFIEKDRPNVSLSHTGKRRNCNIVINYRREGRFINRFSEEIFNKFRIIFDIIIIIIIIIVIIIIVVIIIIIIIIQCRNNGHYCFYTVYCSTKTDR